MYKKVCTSKCVHQKVREAAWSKLNSGEQLLMCAGKGTGLICRFMKDGPDKQAPHKCQGLNNDITEVMDSPDNAFLHIPKE